MVAPCKENGGYYSGDKPPFFTSFAENESEDEEEDGDGSHIHRTGCKRLRTPIQRQVLHRLLQVLLAGHLQEFSCFGIQREFAGRCTSIEVRDQEIWHFIDSVRPGCGVVQIKSLGVMAVAV